MTALCQVCLADPQASILCIDSWLDVMGSSDRDHAVRHAKCPFQLPSRHIVFVASVVGLRLLVFSYTKCSGLLSNAPG